MATKTGSTLNKIHKAVREAENAGQTPNVIYLSFATHTAAWNELLDYRPWWGSNAIHTENGLITQLFGIQVIVNRYIEDFTLG